MTDAVETTSHAAEEGPRAAGSFLRRLWAGEIPLARVFWHYAMIGGSVLNVAATLLAMALLAADAPAVFALVAFALPIPYNLFVLVAVWRSASAYEGPRLLADLARVTCLIWAVAASTL
ncbi:MAG TPA: hypothetical protein VLE23_07340 [Geminicoccaceae bacterium]|nr:hypothetical protein [Geminicoccaceae bacterium]